MSKKRSIKRSKSYVSIPTFRIEQSEKIDITANSGLFLVAELIKKMDIIEKFARLNIYHRQTIGEAVHILALVINQFTGGEAIHDSKNVKDDGALRAIFGNMHIPAPHTSGDFLERFTEETTERLRQIIWKMQEKYLKKLSRRFNRKIMISMDSTVYEVYGNCRENSSQSYKNTFGFHPLLLHIHNTGELLDIIFRPGSDFTSTGAAKMLEENILRLKPYFDKITLLADSGFFEQAVINVCECDATKIDFIITSELNNPIRQKLSAPDLSWKEPEKQTEETDPDVKHRDSHTFNYRLQALKDALKKRGKVLKIRGALEVAEFKHTVAAWGKCFRFVYKRQLIMEQNLLEQSELFEATEEYFYHGYVTNIYDKSIEQIIALIDSRGHQENFIRDFKRGLGTVHIPSKHFYGNYAYFLISMLSWNLKCWLLYVIEPELQIHWKRFRYLFVKVGAQIIKSGRYVIIRFGKNFGRVEEFLTWFARLQEPIFT
ncbi:MAG: IS1380 family transposase [Thermotogota bacterium]|nr:IS1380 family transposase [Thermotogota bacterium]